jgi:cellulose synthase/poly-beta-1,6-N-acetylglucosamine synthase-like glycosyltransferase
MNSTVAYYIWVAIQVVIGYNLVLPLVLYVLFLLKPKQRATIKSTLPPADYAIIVTAYEQTHTLPPVIDSILKLNYENYLVYIVADKCDISTLKFADKRVIVLRPPETLGSNTRSHFYAINRFARQHERLTIIDSDNLVDREYINELNLLFDHGYSAVQGLRKAKNLDTTVACLDAARDMYYHFYDGMALFALGSSATLSGSGMAFTTVLYKECLERLDITGAGFDKVLQKEIVSRGYRIAFAEQAVVYDEKTSGSDQLVKQRARWINTWFRYFKFGFTLVGQGIARFSWNRFLFGVVLLRPPLFIFLLLSVLFMLVNLFVSFTAVLIWGAAFVCFVAGFMLAIAHAKPGPAIYKSLRGIPLFIFYQVLSLLKIRKANSISVATQHSHDPSVNDISDRR